MRITVFDGAGVIGGTKILLEDSGTALFLDFGINFAQKGLYFEEFLQPRATRGILDFLETGLIPPVKGIYRTDLEVPDIWTRFPHSNLDRVDGVLLTHAHLDHSGHISLLREDIPVVMRLLTAVMIKAIQDSGGGGLEGDICYVNPRTFNGNTLGSSRDSSAVMRPLNIVQERPGSDPGIGKVEGFFSRLPKKKKGFESRPMTSVESIGSLPIKVFPVDHSIFGASAYAIGASSGWIVYTGDLRRHGMRRDLTENFVTEASRLKPRVLMVEGTNTETTEPVTEEAVLERCLKVVKGSDRIVVADFGPRNLERLMTFFEISRECGRQLVVSAKDAYLMDALSPLVPQIREAVDDGAFRIYVEEHVQTKGWVDDIYTKYEGRIATHEEITRNQQSYILCFSFWDFTKLIDIDPQGGEYVYSTSEAFDEEQRIDRKRWKQWLDHFHLSVHGFPDITTGKVTGDNKGFHASGHMNGKDILWLIESINPEIVIPVHTEDPGFFKEHVKGKKVIIPEKGVPIGF